VSGPQRRIIPSEELTAFQRWQFNSLLDTPVASEAEPEIQPEPEMVASVAEPVAEEVFEAQPDEAASAAEAMPYPTAEEIEAIHQQAHDEGYQAGLLEGRALAEQQLQQLQQLVQAATETMAGTEAALADSVLELALLVAQQMIGDELRSHPKQMLASIRNALAAIPSATHPAKLFLCPADLTLLQTDLQFELHSDVWRLMADESLAPGSCKIETPTTQVEFSFASRWKKITGVLASNQVPEWSIEQYPVADAVEQTIEAPPSVSGHSVDDADI
jgi:flagellar assembly protein FliH